MPAAAPQEPTAAAPSIAELAPGQRFRGDYACTRKDRLTARNGSPYLSLELRDKTGSITARAFREVDRLGSRFERGDAIRVSGRAERFRGELVAEIDDVRRLDGADLDPGAFLPSAYRDGEELAGFLEHLAREIHDGPLREVVASVLFSEPVAGEFRRAPAPAPAITPTWAGWSSTRWRSGPSSASSANCTHASTPTC